jgi:hypothetical protein
MGIVSFIQNGFETVYNSFNNNRKGFKDFIQTINDIYKCDIEHAKAMKKLYESNCIITHEG